MGEQQQNLRPGQNAGQPSEKLVRCTVARGRTIDVPDTNAPRQTVGYSPDGKALTKLPTRSYGPGQEIDLPAAEVVSLRKRGFLLDPDQTLPPLADGPRYTETGPHASAA
jgi:hypothetical protein